MIEKNRKFRPFCSFGINGKPVLDDIDETIVTALKQRDGLSTKEIAQTINKSQQAVRTRLITLIEKEVVVEVGKGINDPGKKYFLKKGAY